MPNKKIHRIFYGLVSCLFLSVSAHADSALLKSLGASSGGDTVGYLNINTPGGSLYRVYEVAVAVGGEKDNPCQNIFVVKDVKFYNTVKIFLHTTSDPITRGDLETVFGKPIADSITCMKVITYHNSDHTGEVDSTPMPLTPPSSTQIKAAGLPSLTLNLP